MPKNKKPALNTKEPTVKIKKPSASELEKLRGELRHHEHRYYVMDNRA